MIEPILVKIDRVVILADTGSLLITGTTKNGEALSCRAPFDLADDLIASALLVEALAPGCRTGLPTPRTPFAVRGRRVLAGREPGSRVMYVPPYDARLAYMTSVMSGRIQ